MHARARLAPQIFKLADWDLTRLRVSCQTKLTVDPASARRVWIGQLLAVIKGSIII